MRRQDKHLELRVGALICVGLIALGVMVVYFQQFRTHRGVYVLYATFSFAGGIQRGTPVRVAGYHVGQVRSVEWDSGEQVVRAVLEIDLGYRVKKDAKLIIDTVGMLGEPYLEFTAGSPDAPNLKPRATVQGCVPPSLTEIRVEGLAMVTSINKTVKDLNSLIASVRTDVIEQVSERGKQAGTVLAETEKLVKELRVTNEKLSESLDGVTEISARIRDGDGTAHKLIYERELYDNATSLLADADDAAKKLGALADYLKKHPSHLVWGRGVAWYKRAWRWALNKITGGGRKDGEPPPPRPGRSEGRERINLMETTLREKGEGKPEREAGPEQEKEAEPESKGEPAPRAGAGSDS
jgi:phospholipid/cholesterol/gamma-HCH transport system substrate-binding protein